MNDLDESADLLPSQQPTPAPQHEQDIQVSVFFTNNPKYLLNHLNHIVTYFRTKMSLIQ